MSHGTEGAVRAESSLFELCRIASEEDEVKSRKSQKVLSSENRAKCIWTMSSREELRWKQMFLFSHRSHRSHWFYLLSRRPEGAARAESCHTWTLPSRVWGRRSQIAEIAEIIMTDGIFFHLLESSCKRACRIILSIEKSYSLCKMNKGLNVIPSGFIRIIRWIRVRLKK